MAAALSMKLLIDTEAQRVLFAEAGKDVVDFLLSLLTLPVATAVKLLQNDSMVGSIGNLYTSVEKLDDTYVQPGASKDALLRPVVLSPATTSTNSSLLRLPPPPSAQSKIFFRCSSRNPQPTFGAGRIITGCSSYVTDASGVDCPSCEHEMTTACRYVAGGPGPDQNTQDAADAASAEGARGFVQGIVTYTVMELRSHGVSHVVHLEHHHALLNAFAVKDLGTLKEKTVQLGYTEGLAILRASLQSKTVLTSQCRFPCR